MSFLDKLKAHKPLVIICGIFLIVLLFFTVLLALRHSSPNNDPSIPVAEPEFSTEDPAELKLIFNNFSELYKILGAHDYTAFQQNANQFFAVESPSVSTLTLIDNSITTTEEPGYRTIIFEFVTNQQKHYSVKFTLEYIPGGYNSNFSYSAE